VLPGIMRGSSIKNLYTDQITTNSSSTICNISADHSLYGKSTCGTTVSWYVSASDIGVVGSI
jgi:hypothetical protein